MIADVRDAERLPDGVEPVSEAQLVDELDLPYLPEELRDVLPVPSA